MEWKKPVGNDMSMGGYNTPQNQNKAERGRIKEEHTSRDRLAKLEHKDNNSKITGKEPLTEAEKKEMEELKPIVQKMNSRNIEDTKYTTYGKS